MTPEQRATKALEFKRFGQPEEELPAMNRCFSITRISDPELPNHSP